MAKETMNQIDLNNYDNAVLALAQHLGIEGDEGALDSLQDAFNSRIDGPHWYGVSIVYGGAEYAVMTEDEADAACDEAIENFINERALKELPEAYRPYFDREHFKRDALMDSRGYWLAHYDGIEKKEQVDGKWFYIYRTN